MPLRDLLDKFKEVHGTMRLIYMQQLRDYVNRTDYYDVLEEILAVFDKEDLDILIGVGMRGQHYYAVIAQKARVEGII